MTRERLRQLSENSITIRIIRISLFSFFRYLTVGVLLALFGDFSLWRRICKRGVCAFSSPLSLGS
jgi:hypothetical protein